MRNNGGLNNQFSSKNNKPKFNRILLVINVVLFFFAVALSIGGLYYKEYATAVAMLLVMFITATNAGACWKRLRGKKI